MIVKNNCIFLFNSDLIDKNSITKRRKMDFCDNISITDFIITHDTELMKLSTLSKVLIYINSEQRIIKYLMSGKMEKY